MKYTKVDTDTITLKELNTLYYYLERYRNYSKKYYEEDIFYEISNNSNLLGTVLIENYLNKIFLRVNLSSELVKKCTMEFDYIYKNNNVYLLGRHTKYKDNILDTMPFINKELLNRTYNNIDSLSRPILEDYYDYMKVVDMIETDICTNSIDDKYKVKGNESGLHTYNKRGKSIDSKKIEDKIKLNINTLPKWMRKPLKEKYTSEDFYTYIDEFISDNYDDLLKRNKALMEYLDYNNETRGLHDRFENNNDLKFLKIKKGKK